MHDLVIRGATVVDGTGAPAFRGDIAVDDGVITEVGRVAPGAAARERVDADGLLLTPGFVDAHTHYDGQATWDSELAPSSVHGCTTVVMGNCGVGFAPVEADRREWLVQLMEGVEDIPGTAMYEGITWEWETFPQYLDALDRLPHMIDIATQVGHGPLRVYVMRDRAPREPATAADLERMTAILREAVGAGALGFSTNRLAVWHQAKDGTPVPGTFAADEELVALAAAMGDVGRGVLQVVHADTMGDAGDGIAEKEFDLLRRCAAGSGRPVAFVGVRPGMLALSRQARRDGLLISPQVSNRPLGVIIGLTARNPFQRRPSYDEVAGLPVAEFAAALRDPERKRRILAEPCPETYRLARRMLGDLGNFYRLGAEPDYEPGPETAIMTEALAAGRDPVEYLYDALLEDDGRELFFYPGGYNGSLDDRGFQMADPITLLGATDGGAHCLVICDASMTTFMLSYWARDRVKGPQIPLELGVSKITRGAAELYGLTDRGVLAPGKRADLNLIDFDRLRLHRPRVEADLPGGAKRLLQDADGYVATYVAGTAVRRDGAATGATPGRLVRGGRSA